MKRTMFRLALFLGAAIGLTEASTSTAHAQGTPGVEYHVILLDQTGSMASDGGAGATFWDNAVSAATAWVNVDSNTGGTVRRAYAIWTFFDNACPGCGGGNQVGGRQVWPALSSDGSSTTSTDCGNASAMAFEAFSPTLGFCVIKSGLTFAKIAYPAITARLGEVGTIDINTIRVANKAITGVGNTPLAATLCQSLEQMQLSRGALNKVLTLETDAGENNSQGPCSSVVKTTNLSPDATAFAFAQADYGLSVDTILPSWQAKVMRRWVRIISSPPSLDPATNLANETSAVATPIPANFARPLGFTMRVDAHFRICHPTDGPPCPPTTALVTVPGINIPGLGVVTQVMEPKGNKAALATPSFSVLPAATAPVSVVPSAPKPAARTASVQAAAAAPVGVPLINTDEFLFLQALGHVNAKSSFHAIVADSAVVFGTTHVRPGDVDDSNCVDGADFNIVKQKDVYYQRAVQPLQIAIRADLNRDGWVTKADAQIVLDNWGKGCVNSPGPKPKL